MPPAPSDEALTLADGSRVTLDVRRHARARKWSLRYDIQTDRVRLVLPTRASKRAALEWAKDQRDWVAGQRARRDGMVEMAPGAVIPFLGEDVALVHEQGAPRQPRFYGERIVAGGPADRFSARVARWLREEARDILDVESRAYANVAGVTIGKVAVGDARTRWGSCSSEGTLRYSWRLILMPPAVRRYVVAHEVAHRRHMDHGPAFAALEAELYENDVAEARRLLRLWSERVRLVG